MTSVIRNLIDGYNDILISRRDPRVDGWLFMNDPWPTLAICLTYVYTVKVLGPRLMRDRPPIQMRRFLVFYNFAQVIFSAWLFYELMMSGWLTGYSLRCQPIDYSNHPKSMRMVYACWWYYFSKFTEFFDTFFFILRKKFQHVSHLHVIHHGIMPMSVWFGVKFTPGGHSTFFGLLNTFVHVIMYFYYMMAAMGPKYHKYLWWKRYLTTLQMVQFVCIITHAFQLLFIECNYPRGFVWWIGGHAVLFLFLFLNFYRKAYKKPKKGGSMRSAYRIIARLMCLSSSPDLYEIETKTSNGTSAKDTSLAAAVSSLNGSVHHRTVQSADSVLSNGNAHKNGHVTKNGSSTMSNGVVSNGHLAGVD